MEELKPHKEYQILGQTVKVHCVSEDGGSVWKIVDENDIMFTPHCVVKFTASSDTFKRNDLKVRFEDHAFAVTSCWNWRSPRSQDKVKEAQGEGGLRPYTEYEGSEGHLFFGRALASSQLDALNSNAGKVGEVEVKYEWVDGACSVSRCAT